jgi:hypothetical protein
MGAVRIAPTNDRRVVGVMNEFAFDGERLWKAGPHDLEALSFRGLARQPAPDGVAIAGQVDSAVAAHHSRGGPGHRRWP